MGMSNISQVNAANQLAAQIEAKYLSLRERGEDMPLNRSEAVNFSLLDLGGTLFSWHKDTPAALFNGVITSASVDSAAKMLDDFEDHDEVQINFTTPGGEVNAGIALANLFNTAKQKITMNVISSAFSAGSVALMGADERRIAKGAEVGVHPAWGIVMGNAAKLEESAKAMRKADERILELFAERVPKDKMEDFTEKYNSESFILGKEAVKLGLADSTLSMKQAKAAARATASLKKPKAKPAAKDTAEEESDSDTANNCEQPAAEAFDPLAAGCFHALGDRRHRSA